MNKSSKTMQAYKMGLTKLTEKVRTAIEDGCNVADKRKMYLVQPFIQNLGYDIFDPKEVGYNERVGERESKTFDLIIYREDGKISIVVEYASFVTLIPQLKYIKGLPSIYVRTDGINYAIYHVNDEYKIVYLKYAGGLLSADTRFKIETYRLSKGVFNEELTTVENSQEFLNKFVLEWLKEQAVRPSKQLISAFLSDTEIDIDNTQNGIQKTQVNIKDAIKKALVSLNSKDSRIGELQTMEEAGLAPMFKSDKAKDIAV